MQEVGKVSQNLSLRLYHFCVRFCVRTRLYKPQIRGFLYATSHPFRISASYSISSANSPSPNIDRRRL